MNGHIILGEILFSCILPSSQACRDKTKTIKAAKEVQRVAGNKARIETMHLDLSSYKSIRQFVDEFKSKNIPLHILINNAGLITPYKKTEDGNEMTFGTKLLCLLKSRNQPLGTFSLNQSLT